jgi:hypothetical protein
MLRQYVGPSRAYQHQADSQQYEKTAVDEDNNYRLVESIERNAHHYLEIFSRAVDKCLPPPTKEIKYAFRQPNTAAIES